MTAAPVAAGLLAFALAAGAGADAVAQRSNPIRGAWRPMIYQLEDGARHPVDGLIVFTETDWSVVYFVLDGRGEPGRGTGEGGTYTLEGDRLVFAHRFNVSGGRAMDGLPAAPLSMVVRRGDGAQLEPSRIELSGDRLVISFPSGNRMEFRRSSSP